MPASSDNKRQFHFYAEGGRTIKSMPFNEVADFLKENPDFKYEGCSEAPPPNEPEAEEMTWEEIANFFKSELE